MSSPEKKDPEPSTPKSEGSFEEVRFEGGRNAGLPSLPQGPTAHTFGGGALFGALNQQAPASISGGVLSSAASTGGLGESTFGFGGGNTGTTKSGFGTSGTTFGFGSSGGTTFGSVPGTAGSGGSLFGSTSPAAQSSTGGRGLFGGTGGGFGQSAGAFGQPAAQPSWRGSAGAGGHRGPLPSGGGGGGLFGESGPGPSDGDGDTNAVPFGQIRPFGSTRPQQPNQPRAPRTWFYLVCGGESVPEKERRSREQMNLIYDTIIKKGMATKEHIVFVYGRGQKLNNSVTRSFEATGYTFKLYGPQMQQGGGLFGGPAPQQKKCPLPGNEDNAVVIFIGQGKYSPIINDNGGGLFAYNNSPTASADTFGDLLFINTASYATMYAATLKDLKAKNTLFISLADYSGEAFRRAFDETLKARNRKMFVVCLSDSLHSAKDYCLASAFSDFLDEEDWKNKTVEEFTQVIEEKYAYHAAVEEKRGEVVQYTEDDYNHQVKETGAWATGNFSNLVHKPIPSYDWAMFREVEELKETVDDANVGELSTHMKEKLDSFIDNMEQLRTEAIQVNLHLPRAFETVGDSDVCSMTWKDFLLLKD